MGDAGRPIGNSVKLAGGWAAACGDATTPASPRQRRDEAGVAPPPSARSGVVGPASPRRGVDRNAGVAGYGLPAAAAYGDPYGYGDESWALRGVGGGRAAARPES